MATVFVLPRCVPAVTTFPFTLDLPVGTISSTVVAANAGVSAIVAFCMFTEDKKNFLLVFAKKFDHVRDDMYVAVMRHEFAHIVDEHISELEKARLFGVGILRLPTERRVDRIAELIWKQPIYYDKKYLIQNLKGGYRPRPSHLPQ